MADREKVIRALENCTDKIKCRDCPWEPCEDFDYTHSEYPDGLIKDALELLAEYDDFCRFVTAGMLDEKNECGTCGAGEVFCRKLVKLGYMKLEDDVYSEVEHG